MHPLFLILFVTAFAIHPQANDNKLLNITWKVTEIKQWESMNKMYKDVSFHFAADNKLLVKAGNEFAEGTYSVHPTPPDLEVVFSRKLGKTTYEAKDDFNVEYANDSYGYLKTFFQG